MKLYYKCITVALVHTRHTKLHTQLNIYDSGYDDDVDDADGKC